MDAKAHTYLRPRRQISSLLPFTPARRREVGREDAWLWARLLKGRKAAAKAQRLKSAEEYGHACLRDDGKTKQDCMDAIDRLEKVSKRKTKELVTI
eukprot:1141753-Pelagomonas_calceolata.AAC.1